MPPKSKVRVRVASGESKRKSVVFNYFCSMCDGETQWDDKNFYWNVYPRIGQQLISMLKPKFGN